MVIGVCLSELHYHLNTGYVAALDRAARKTGAELLVFNNTLDFTCYEKGSPIARSIFRVIRYDLLSALIIISNSFHDEELFDDIVRQATARRVPVISVGSPHEGCYSFVNDPEPAFKALLRHVIRDHGVTDTWFLGGVPGEETSEFRLRCYREVLSEFHLPFSEENTGWGEYWAQPASAAVIRLLQERGKPPRAIFCANDTMAAAVCETLKSHGFRVPEDVIVTGFDGLPSSSMIHPRLSTVSDDQDALAEATVDLINRLGAGEKMDHVLKHPFHAVFSESCGCPAPEENRYDALSLFTQLELEHTHENQLFHTVEHMLTQTEPDDFFRILSHALPPNSAVQLNRSFLDVFNGRDYTLTELENSLLRIPHADRKQTPKPVMTSINHNSPVSDARTGVTLVSSIHSDSVVFGYFSAQTQNLIQDSQLLKRLSDVLNLIFTIQLGNLRQRNLLSHIEQSLYRDSLTGMTNLKGLTRWYLAFTAEPQNHLRSVALSVYEISRYSFIYETYGIEETEAVVRRISETLRRINAEAGAVARISENQFVVLDLADSDSLLSEHIDRTVADFYRTMNAYNAENSRDYYVEIHAGCTTMSAGWETTGLENLIRLAVGEMYLNRLQADRHDVAKDTQITAALYNTFSLLIEKNLFQYFFQPIVDARSGRIFAYEALMRTDALINLSPLQVLAVAREYGRLYEVEKATFFGIMERYVRDFSDFQGCRVFVNTIPGHFLTVEDCNELTERFGSYLDCFVFELTEQDVTTDEELARLKRLAKPGSQAQIAIDDYGAGHSNMVNVLRYEPQIIKIDRELITGIDQDTNKQLFVQNTIDFAHQNGIRALAEGVETAEELRTVIACGIDLIQGYFTARPARQPIREINPNTRRFITDENLRRVRFSQDETKVYTARDGESVNLYDLAMHHYASLAIPSGEVILRGQPGSFVDLTVRIADGAETTLILENSCLKAANEPSIQLGSGSRVNLVLRENSIIRRDGIRVPPNAFLTVTGNGSLFIDSSRNYSVGIGGNFNDPYGTITFDLDGHVEIHASGDKAVCIGGCRSSGEGIRICRGNLTLLANGVNGLGMGSADGNAEIRIDGGTVKCHVQGNDTVGIGTLNGHISLTAAAEVNVLMDSERAVGIGTLNGTTELRLSAGTTDVVLHCDAGACIGSLNGEGAVFLSGADVHFHGEGNRLAGLGSVDGACDARIEGGRVSGDLLASVRQLLGNENSRVIVTGGNVQLYPEDAQRPVSPDGSPLLLMTPEGDVFEQTFRDRRATWHYTARRDADGHLAVWILPEAGTE